MEPWIRLANLLPPDTRGLEHPEDAEPRLLKKLFAAFIREFPDIDLNALRNQYPKWYERLRKKRHRVRLGAIQGRRFRSAEQLYPLFHAIRTAIGALADGVARTAATRKKTEVQLPPLDTIVLVALSPDGTARLSAGAPWYPYYEFLTRLEGVEVRRVKRCPICEKFFWAQRKKAACSARCGNTYRVRFYRENAAKYAANRRRNRRANKARAEGRIFKVRVVEHQKGKEK